MTWSLKVVINHSCHGINGKRVYLFEKKNIGFWKFKDELNLVDYDWYDINWKKMAFKNKKRNKV